MDFKQKGRGIWQYLEAGMRREKWHTYILISKINGKYIFQSVENIRNLIQNINANKVTMLHYHRQHF